jgi:DNA replication and repair protein RecF
MRVRQLTLRHFRNIAGATLAFSGRQQFLLGANGQGKTNLLEAAGYVTALRSFRATDHRRLIAHHHDLAEIACGVEHERQGETLVSIALRPDGKELWVDRTRIARLADHLGQFPTVVFSSQDLQLVRGSPSGRRRWLDLTLAAVDAGYFRVLQTYTRAVAERNALLKSGRHGAAELDAFEEILAPAAAGLVALRSEGIAALATLLREAYGRICDEPEPVALEYAPNFAGTDAAAFRARFEANRARDAQFRTTLVGPHRDDVRFTVKGAEAKDFASEGQQRSLVLALRLAQTAWSFEKTRVRPVLLADDVLGELDPARRRRFWAAIDPETQIVATGTRLPEADLGTWQIFDVTNGEFTERSTR